MSRWNPCRRREFVRRIRALGFDGPFSGTRHQFLIFAGHRLTVPSNNEFGVPMLRMMIREVEGIIGRRLSAAEWNSL